MFRRPMACAGSWYPADAKECGARIEKWWARPPKKNPPAGVSPARLGVVPHAGWTFSGRLAAQVFQALPDDRGVELVVVLGGHLRPDDPVVAMTEGHWETPFGAIAIDGGFRPALESLPAVIFEDERRHFEDNTVELQLPFVKFRFPRAALLPIRVPPGPVALNLGRLLHDYISPLGARVLVIASTDLTHYGPAYGFEPKGRGADGLRWMRDENDQAFIAAMTSEDGGRILKVAHEFRNACSPGAVAALAQVAVSDHAHYRTLDYATSSEVDPRDPVNFVGYVGGIFSPSPA